MKYYKKIIYEDNGHDIKSIGVTISLTQFAKKLKVDRSYISRVLSGKVIPSEDFYIKIKSIL